MCKGINIKNLLKDTRITVIYLLLYLVSNY